MSTLDITKPLYTSLELECVEAGTNLTEVCREAGVHRSTVQRWKDQEPKTIVEIREMMKVISAKKAERSK